MAKRHTLVYYSDTWMIAGWPEKIQDAQILAVYEIAGEEYPRVAYGAEADNWGADRQPCHDCRAVRGQFHVVGCDVERCPRCGGQAIGCECLDDE